MILREILFWWTLVGGLVPALLVAGTLWSDPRYKLRTRVVFGVLLGPCMWVVQFLAGCVAFTMYVIHSFKRVKLPPFPPIPKQPASIPPVVTPATK